MPISIRRQRRPAGAKPNGLNDGFLMLGRAHPIAPVARISILCGADSAYQRLLSAVAEDLMTAAVSSATPLLELIALKLLLLQYDGQRT
jgi:hypothetical protein